MTGEITSVLFVDGYNVLNAWKGTMKDRPLREAREDLIHALADYSGYSGEKVILVFDAWKSERAARTVEELPATLSVVYTKKGETADHYIERMCDEIKETLAYSRLIVRVATSDQLEQTIVLGRGAIRISARELLRQIEEVRHPAKPAVNPARVGGSTVMERLPEETRRKLEALRDAGK